MSGIDREDGIAAEGRRGLERLVESVRGEALWPGDAEYESARSVWNAMADRHPALILRPTGAADIARAVGTAADHGLPISVRGGGHNVAGLAVCDGGLMLDLSRLRSVRVDPTTDSVRVGPGAVWGDVDHETWPFRRVVPSGLISNTGVAGLTLGGGFGWTARMLGLTCDRLRSADVVTASGDTVHASESAHPELFWALRGGGGNYGVVTSFELESAPLPQVFAGMRWFPFERAAEVVRAFRELTAAAPRELGSLLVLRKAPPAPFLPAAMHGQLAVAVGVCFAGTEQEARSVIGPLTALPGSAADTLGPKAFPQFQQMLDAGQPFGRRYYWKTHYFDDWPADAEDVIVSHASRVESPHSAVLCMQLGGAITDVPDEESAVANRGAAYVVNIQAAWEDAREDGAHMAWAREYWSALEPWGCGQYVNFLAADAGRVGLEAAYGRERLRRLAAIKRDWDPANLFRANHNIEPAGYTGS